MISVAVIGSKGQLGTDLVETLQMVNGYRVFALSHEQIDCAEEASVRRVLAEMRPEVVVNCAAFDRVDECESSPAEAFRVNSLGAFYVARACAEINALCVYISTDYVFDGGKGYPYTEEDQPRPINVYGTSKLAGEHLVRQTCPQWLIVRMAALFGAAGALAKGGNFVESVLSKARRGEVLRIVKDIRTSPTYTWDAAQVLERLIQHRSTGIFHVVNEGGCSWFELAQEVMDTVKLSCKLEAVSFSDYPMKARRPQDSRLKSIRLDPALRGALRPWQEAVRVYLAEKGYLASG